MKKTFIIAEIGINHNGDIQIAKKLIEMASKTGCDAVKFQKRDINTVYTKEELDKPRQSPWGATQRDQKLGLEFGEKEYTEIDKFCKEKEIIWFASAWDEDSLKFLDKFDLKYNKIASAMIVDKNFLEEAAKREKYTFISTGMSTLSTYLTAVAADADSAAAVYFDKVESFVDSEGTSDTETTDVALKGQTISSSYKPAVLNNCLLYTSDAADE